ncbi:hypothetical protein BIW11_11558 [Tropilaelaps mercedesae]|uniref:Uncharacterized protein n=1 Tax=Tropilaelaps mercedesae TaxID=418985 RepID=A0A1V9XAH2_9ACAR|nr:hypothetical protein BIW11_11558 [Tropilaelaps mercedesae]
MDFRTIHRPLHTIQFKNSLPSERIWALYECKFSVYCSFRHN